MINLTEEEREHFTAWLDQEAATEQSLLDEMAKLQQPLLQAIIDKRTAEMKALRATAAYLRSWQQM